MKKIIEIDGMHCDKCKSRVFNVLSNIDGIKNVLVSLEDNNAIIEFDKEISLDLVKESIEDLGFNVINIK